MTARDDKCKYDCQPGFGGGEASSEGIHGVEWSISRWTSRHQTQDSLLKLVSEGHSDRAIVSGLLPITSRQL